MATRALGIEIGRGGLRAVQLRRTRQGYALERATALACAPERPWLEALPEMLLALRDRMRAEGFRLGLPAAVAPPADSLFYQSLDTDLQDLADVRRVLPFETEGDFPLPADELVIEILSARREAAGGQALLLGAMRRQTVEAVRAAVERAGLRCARIDANAAALHAFIGSEDAEAAPRALIHAGDSSTLLLIAQGGRLVTARRLARDAAIGRELELTWRDAFNTALPASANVRVLGGESEAAGLADAIGKETGVRVERAGSETDPVYATAIGLARRAVEVDARAGNFAAVEWNGADSSAGVRRALSVSGVLLCGIALLWMVGTVATWRSLERRDRNVRAESARIAAALFPAAPASAGERPQDLLLRVEDKLAAARKESDAFGALVGRGASPLYVLQQISARIPVRVPVRISEMTIADRSVRLTGTTDSYKSVDEIKGRLAVVPEFAGIAIQDVGVERGTQAIRFTLMITMKAR